MRRAGAEFEDGICAVWLRNVFIGRVDQDQAVRMAALAFSEVARIATAGVVGAGILLAVEDRFAGGAVLIPH